MRRRACLLAGIAMAATMHGTPTASAEEGSDFDPFPPEPAPAHYTAYGGVGLIETRSARMAPVNTLAGTVSYSPAIQRYNITFQPAPWLETTFGYSIFDIAPNGNERFDRQFDIKARLWREGIYIPEVAIGLQDFLGTGVFSGEYIVASKAYGPLDLSFGVGWGRLGSSAELPNPLTSLAEGFGNRNRADDGTGGAVNFGQFFQGDDIGLFGGVIYETPVEGLRLIAEYDSDDKSPIQDFDDNIPFNFGVSYAPYSGISLTGAVLKGSEFQLTATFGTDVSKPVQDAPKEQNYTPFAVREGRGIDPLAPNTLPPVGPLGVTPIEGGADTLAEALAERLRPEGIGLRKVVLGTDTLQITIENDRYRSVPQAIGRVTRILSALAPLEVEEFRIAVVERGMTVSEFDIDRERLEVSARQLGWTASPPTFADSYHTVTTEVLEGETVDRATYPRPSWSIGPDVRVSTFDPDNPLRYNFDVVAEGQLEVFEGAFVSGTLRADVFGNFDEIDRESDSVLPRVRSEFANYYRETDIGVDRLTADYFFKPTDTTYAHLSGGLIEQSFGGIGGEVLWRPQNSSFAFGLEGYYVKQRDFDTLFSFRDYDVITGHASAYWDTGFYDVDLAVHAGRYLAGDWGATFEASKRLPNGWEIGAFATFTDVSFDDFGEGSFDKGLTFSIPFDWGLPYETRSTANITLRPVQRDGGQRLEPATRLFRLTQPASRGDVEEQWSDFSK